MRDFFTIRRVFVLVIFAGFMMMTARGIADPDVWWHLRTGQHIIQNYAIPHSDFYSFTNYGRPWVTHEWLTEVVMYGLYRQAGWSGLIVFFGAVITAAFWLAYRSCALQARPYIAGTVTLVAAGATIPFWGARPQMLSLLLTSVFLYCLARHRATGNEIYLWGLPPLTLVWVNLHGGYAVGLALIALAGVGAVLDRSNVGAPSWSGAVSAAAPYAVIFGASLLAVPLNPNGWRMYTYPFETLASPAMQSYIVEWASPDFHLPRFQLFALLLMATFVLMVISTRRTRPSDLLFVCCTAYAALRSSRHVPIFALVAIPVLATHASGWLLSKRWTGWLNGQLPAPAPSSSKLRLNAVLALAIVSACALRITQMASRQPAFESEQEPRAAAEFMLRERPRAPIFNSYDWGGYLIWKLYPHYRVYIDGRADLYGDSFMDEYVTTYRGEADWRRLFRRFDIHTVVIAPQSPLAGSLREEPAWQNVFEDRQAIIFTRRDDRPPAEAKASAVSPQVEKSLLTASSPNN